MECMGFSVDASSVVSVVNWWKYFAVNTISDHVTILMHRSVVLFIACIMAFVWRIRLPEDSTWTFKTSQALFPRLTISTVLGLGVIYFALILDTLRRYGHVMDNAWKKLASGWIQSKRSPYTPPHHPSFRHGLSSSGQRVNRSPLGSYGSSEEKSATREQTSPWRRRTFSLRFSW